MDVESPIKPQSRWSSLDILEFAAPLLRHEDFSTTVSVFPGSYAWAPWGTKGEFFISFTVYDAGEKLGEIHTEFCTQDGHITVDFGQFLKHRPSRGDGAILAKYHHASDIPVELYFANVHKKTGTYLSYPSLPFMGDKLYPEQHTQQLENTMFWPGLINDHTMTASVVVVNPYKVSFSYQISLFKPDGERVQTEPLKLKPFRSSEHKIEDLFPEVRGVSAANQGAYSICIAAQYKLVAFHKIVHNQSKAITALDHLHSFCLI